MVLLAVEKSCDSIAKEVNKLTQRNKMPTVLVSPQIRPGLKQITQAHLPKLVVLSFNEVTRDTKIESLGLVSDGER